MQTVNYKQFQIVVRELTVEDELAYLRWLKWHDDTDTPDAEPSAWGSFVMLVVQSEQAQNLGFTPEKLVNAPRLDVEAAYATFIKLPSKFVRRWRQAVTLENQAEETDLGPEPLGEKADPLA